jgi:hypothetical protein
MPHRIARMCFPSSRRCRSSPTADGPTPSLPAQQPSMPVAPPTPGPVLRGCLSTPPTPPACLASVDAANRYSGRRPVRTSTQRSIVTRQFTSASMLRPMPQVRASRVFTCTFVRNPRPAPDNNESETALHIRRSIAKRCVVLVDQPQSTVGQLAPHTHRPEVSISLTCLGFLWSCTKKRVRMIVSIYGSFYCI